MCVECRPEAGLLRAYLIAGGPVFLVCRAFLDGVQSRCGSDVWEVDHLEDVDGRLYRVSRSDELDVSFAQFFANSSLAPVLVLRRRLKSVADVLERNRGSGFSQARWVALCDRWRCCLSSWSMRASALLGAVGPLDPHDLHGFYKRVFDALEVLDVFVRQLVTSRRDAGLRNGLVGCMRILEMGLITGCVLILFLPPLFLLLRTRNPTPLVFWLSPILLIRSSVRLGCPIFVGLVPCPKSQVGISCSC